MKIKETIPCVLAHFDAFHIKFKPHEQCVFGHFLLGKCSHHDEIKSRSSNEHDLPTCLSYKFKFNSFITTTYTIMQYITCN